MGSTFRLTLSRSAVVLVGAANVAAAAGSLAGDVWLASHGYPDRSRGSDPTTWAFLAAWLSSVGVGSLAAWLQPRHPAGWLFLLLGSAISVGSAAIDTVAVFGLDVEPHAHTMGAVAAVLSDISFVWFLAPLALVLLLTPTGRPLSPRWRWVARLILPAAAVACLLALVSVRPLDAPYEDVTNPWRNPAVARFTDPMLVACVYYLMLAVLLGGVSLVLRFRRARGEERRQLAWLTLAAATVPPSIAVAFVAIALGLSHDVVVLVSVMFIVSVPIGTGLAVLRFQLYDVDRFVTRAVTYGLLSAVLTAVYAVAVLAVARVPGERLGPPAVGATIGAVAAALLFLPLRSWLQDTLDRRFNKRRYRAEATVRAALEHGKAGGDVDALLRDALEDPSAYAVFADEVSGRWIRADGRQAAAGDDTVPATHAGTEVARLHHDPARSDPGTVRAVAELAAGELDNIRLRAHLRAAGQRLVAAQFAERRRVEQDLHDGAQQSLLALAFELRAAELSGEPTRMRTALAAGAEAAGRTIRELRELANGLRPAALTDGGLPAALEETARRATVPVELSVDVPRLPEPIELTAWFLVTEIIVNAQKHAAASRIQVQAHIADDRKLHLAVTDDGVGGADSNGNGLRGLRDRADTIGGHLSLHSPPGQGTVVEVVLPCGL
ncbi:histidine kinase [Pseudofrankia sp. BMG5.37]|uniref:sensor histidine kinase n=1 Tax=Pseudofrankia sp. BMG5.37 TaxID=3050035 RepID=UPI002895C590|nr:histidine kinase [Pseudofrankia sp. BMG5.37]MDT3442691.1 histidine kinase [Pseudofrankia sp. BMG5.37]